MLKKLRFLIFPVALAALLSVTVVPLIAGRSRAASATPDTGVGENGGETDAKNQKAVNILVLGTDQVSASTDVIFIARLDGEENVSLVQIPRDTYTAEHGKLNSLFAKAYHRRVNEGASKDEAKKEAAGELSAFLSSSLGIRLDGHVLITLEDFRAIVDSVDGVDVELPKDLNYDDEGQGLHIHLKAGKNHLNGKDAEGLVRCRNEYLTADYGRMDAQKLFLTALYKKVRHSLSLPALVGLTVRTWQAVETDLSLPQTLSLARRVWKTDFSKLRFATLKGRSVRVGGQSCEVIPQKTLETAALALGAPDTAAIGQNAFVGSDEALQKAYLSPPTYNFSFTFAEDIDQNGIAIR